MSFRKVAAFLALAASAASPLTAQTPDYMKAERFLSWHASPLISGDDVNPTWIANGNRFWYRNKTGSGTQFMIVDPVRNTQGPLFDHARLAAALSLANDTTYEPHKLPFNTIRFVKDEGSITFRLGKKQFNCDIRAYQCLKTDTLPGVNWAVVSPDSLWEVFAEKNDLWLRRRTGKDTVRLTNDGEPLYMYGVNAPRAQAQMRGGEMRQRPQVTWSPDSKKLVVTRTDERKVEKSWFVSMTGVRTRGFSQPYALPGDSIIPITHVHVLDLAPTMLALNSGGDTKASMPANLEFKIAPTAFRTQVGSSSVDSVWSSKSDKVYLTAYTRGAKKHMLIELDANTKQQRILAVDSAKTNVIGQEYIEPKSWYVTRDGQDVIWWSERDGWAHLWRFDGNTGAVKNQITSGAWTVGVIERVDELKKQIYFIGRGREPGPNPYYARLYRVNYDGSGLTLLTPEDANHDISFAPTGEYFVDTYSRIESPSVSVLRRADGTIVRTLQKADISRLTEMGWKPAQPFVVKGRDGVTDVYGVIYFPPQIDSTKKYPVIEHIYPGPFVGSVGSWSFKAHGENFALAQLGFIVVQMDHIGTRHRSKAFHDNYYGNMGDNGIPDHVVGLKQLAARYPFMDLDRVGIYGHSGGGFASTDAILRFPEFYKVAVSGAGNHDQQTYGHYWGEVYQGLMRKDTIRKTTNYDSQANRLIANNLKGRLLLMHGDMDDNVHPAMTIQMVDALIKANKDFDLIIAPDRAHGLNEPYFIRRRWDYFVSNLMGGVPPKEYRITQPAGASGN